MVQISSFPISQNEKKFLSIFQKSKVLRRILALTPRIYSSSYLVAMHFRFGERVFVLPNLEKFKMNSINYHIPDMDDLCIFVGYRGNTHRYLEPLTPGIFRKRNNPSKINLDKWERRSRIAGNVLKQRFLECEKKPLTELQALGIMQHHYAIGPTDLLDLTFDVNIAKWFALNQMEQGKYVKKKFIAKNREASKKEASQILTVVVRPLGARPIDEEYSEFFTRGLSLYWWDGTGAEGVPQSEFPPYNLGPLWSEYPRRQKGFGLHGVGSQDTDKWGSVLMVTEHLFHPKFHKDGWEKIGGPEIVIDRKKFSFDEDSSHMAEFLFPDPPNWFNKILDEVRNTIERT